MCSKYTLILAKKPKVRFFFFFFFFFFFRDVEKSKEHLDPPKNHTPRRSAQPPIRSRSLSRSRPTLGCGHGFKVPADLEQPCEGPFFEVCPTELEQPCEGTFFEVCPTELARFPSLVMREGLFSIFWVALLPLSFKPRTIRLLLPPHDLYEVMETPQNFVLNRCTFAQEQLSGESTPS